jgi:hypothetical protein
MTETVTVVPLTVAVTVALPVALLGCTLSWRMFRHFSSRGRNYPTSSLRYFLKQVRFAAGAGILSGATVGALIYGAVVLSPHIVAPQQTVVEAAPITSATAASVSHELAKSSVAAATADPYSFDRVSYSTSVTKEPASAPPSRVVLTERRAPATGQNSCTKLRLEVERLEREKDYSGDDEIVRDRLGLPPRPTCRE